MKDEKWWGAHIYLAGEIAECAGKLANNMHGYPGRLDKIPKKGVPKYSNKNEKRWREILIKIRDGFGSYHKSNGDFYEWKDGKVPKMEFVKQPDGSSLVKFNPPSCKTIVNREKRRKFREAMGLFVKYFDDLWD